MIVLGGRRTPHARVRYDTSLRTPGTADNKPLVSAQVMAAPDESPEDEESVSLLDRLVHDMSEYTVLFLILPASK